MFWALVIYTVSGTVAFGRIGLDALLATANDTPLSPSAVDAYCRAQLALAPGYSSSTWAYVAAFNRYDNLLNVAGVESLPAYIGGEGGVTYPTGAI